MGFDFCCRCIIPCDCECEYCKDQKAPCCLTLTFDGIQSGSCEDCGDFTTVFARQDPLNLCRWYVTLCPQTCDEHEISVELTNDGYGTCSLTVKMGENTWEKDLGSCPPDCCAFDETLSNTASGGKCDTSGSTVRVQANNVDNCYGPCAHCSTGAPAYLAITPVGLGSFDPLGALNCADCTCWNGATFYAELDATCCAWTRTGVSVVCICSAFSVGVDQTVAAVSYNAGDGHYYLTITAFGNSYRADLGTDKPDCREWEDVWCTLIAEGSTCEGGYMLVSAVPPGAEDGGPVPGSQFCQDCGDGVPATIYVDITGAALGGCCDGFLGTYALTRVGNTCAHTYQFPSNICWATGLSASWAINGAGEVVVTVVAYGPGGYTTGVVSVNLGDAMANCSTADRSVPLILQSPNTFIWSDCPWTGAYTGRVYW